MAYEYSLEEHIYEGGAPAPGEWKRPTQTLYHPVPKEMAEADPCGRWRIKSVHGNDMTGWQSFVDYFPESDYGKGKPLPDATGQPLAAHDFVMSGFNGYKELHLAEVVRFTPKKIVIRRGNSEYAKFPTDIIKVDKSLFL